MYLSLRLHRARARVCVRVVCVCGGVLHSCKLRESIDIQTFYQASAFNADIGAWNTARVATLYQVCAAPDARGGVVDAARAVVRGTADARARVRRRVGARMRGCPRVCA